MPCVWPVRVAGVCGCVAGVRMVCVCGCGVFVCGRCVCVVWARKGGPVAGPPFCGVQAAVSYSPTPWRVQYHRRWQS